MSELLLDKQLRLSEPDSEIRNVARARTLTVLPQLDANRKGNLIKFLSESKLLEIISLNGADLSNADLIAIRLRNADLSEADLSGSNLYAADLSKSDLSCSDLSCANLSGAFLKGTLLFMVTLSNADLREAYLKEAEGITTEELEKQAKSLKDAIMPDGSKHE